MAKISIKELEALVTQAWAKEVDASVAKYITAKTMIAALQKDDRFDAVAETLNDLEIWAGLKTRKLKVVSTRGASTCVDLNGAPGIVFLKDIVERSVAAARKYGVSAISLKNSGGVHMLSSWVEDFPSYQMMGIFAWNGGSYTTVPYGSRQPFFGTNPIAYAVPTKTKPIILDMATSEIAFKTLSLARKAKTPLGPRQGLDSTGAETLDPNEVYNPSVNEDVRLLPMGGGYKGTAIMLLMELMTGALVGAKMSREATDDPFTPEEFGGLLLVFDIAAFTDTQKFVKSVDTMASQIRASQPAKGFKSVQLPGDAGHEREARGRAAGQIELSDATLDRLRTFAAKGTKLR